VPVNTVVEGVSMLIAGSPVDADGVTVLEVQLSA
jgi:hypothetical protein